jgi:septal ring factor EnvC (AmiA/AmiB activator)
MLRPLIFLALVCSGSALAAQQSTLPPPPPVAQAAPTAADLDALQQRLLASQQVIATLQRELADEKSRAGALEQCRIRNGRLVSIGRQLVEGYNGHYNRIHGHDPFQLGRRRFEFELQALSEAIYDNKADVPLRTLPGGTAITGEPEKVK